MTAAIELRGLRKVYRGRPVLDGVDLEVAEGSVFGFLGPNGAGKTTTLRIVTGLARATSGSARVLGSEVGEAGNAIRAQIGFVPDVPAFYDWMTARELLEFAGSLFGLEHRILRERSAMLLDMAGLAGVTTRVGGFSRGMRQRLGIAQGLINAPRLLLLDEPTSALDPIGRKEVLDLVSSLGGRTTVFFSTHILGDVERVCDTVAILDRGRVLAQAPLRELTSRYAARRILIQTTGDLSVLAVQLRARPWVTEVVARTEELEVAVTEIEPARREIPGLIAASGLGLVRFEAGEPALEDVFVDLVGEAGR